MEEVKQILSVIQAHKKINRKQLETLFDFPPIVQINTLIHKEE